MCVRLGFPLHLLLCDNLGSRVWLVVRLVGQSEEGKGKKMGKPIVHWAWDVVGE